MIRNSMVKCLKKKSFDKLPNLISFLKKYCYMEFYKCSICNNYHMATNESIKKIIESYEVLEKKYGKKQKSSLG